MKRSAPDSPEGPLANKGLRTISPPKSGCIESSFVGQVIKVNDANEVINDDTFENVIQNDAFENVVEKDALENLTSNENSVTILGNVQLAYIDESSDSNSSDEKVDNYDNMESTGANTTATPHSLYLAALIKQAVISAITPLVIELKQEVKHSVKKVVEPLKQEIELLKLKVQSFSFKLDGQNTTKADERNRNASLLNPICQKSPAYIQSSNEWGIPGQGKTKFPKSYSQITAGKILQSGNAVQTQLTPREVNPILKKKTIPVKPSQNPAYGLSRRCQGFHPITSKHLNKYDTKYLDIKDEEKRFQRIGMDCVRDFVHKEMLMAESTTEDLRIKSVFYPSAGAASGTLYAEFWSEEEVEIIKRHAKNLVSSSDGFRPKIVTYVPQSLFERYKAVEEAAFLVRQADRSKATRVWITDDIRLRVRKKGDTTPWSQIEPENLINLPPQAPIKARLDNDKDLMEKQTPPTPMFTPLAGSNIKSAFCFESNNHFNLLGEVEAQ